MIRRYPAGSNQDYGAFKAPPKQVSAGSGTVTSVDLTMPAGFAVSGNPVTTSGTLTVTGGPSAQFVTMAANADLANERVLTAGSGISITDGGAGGNVTIATTGVSARRWDWVFGDGSAGSPTFDGSSAVTGFSRSGSTYTANGTQVLMWQDVTINAGVIVKLNNTQPWIVNGTLTCNGTINADGNNAVTTSPGGGVTANYHGTGCAGGPVNTAGATTSQMLGSAGGAGGSSGGGGGVGGGPGAGGVTIPTQAEGGIFYAFTINALVSGVIKSAGNRYAGGSGGGGGSQASGAAGAGGAGGLVLSILARFIAGSGSFTAKGGNGSAASSGNSGGGGGGGGGCLMVVTTTSNWASLVTTDVSGGTGGAFSGTGNTGAGGSSGRLIQLILD